MRIIAISQDECSELLKRVSVGRLACSLDNQRVKRTTLHAVQGAHGYAPAAGELGNELDASRRQNGNENASSNRKSVLQNCNSQIRPVTAEPLAHVIAGKGSRNRSQAAEDSPLRKRPLHNTINCCPAYRTRHDAGRKGRGIQSTGCKGQLVCNQFAYRKIGDSFRRRG